MPHHTNPPLHKNDELTLCVEGITNLGYGVAHADGLTVFISDTIPGDVARVRIIKVAADYAVARQEELLTPSPDRVYDRCPIEGCRSCAYRHVSYQQECRIKFEAVRHEMNKAGLTDVTVHPVTPSPITQGYRNKAQYPIARAADGRYLIGFYAPKTHRVTEAAACPLTPASFRPILEELRRFFTEKQLSVYDEESGRGLLRHLYLRRGEVTGEILLTLIINGTELPYADELIPRLLAVSDALVGILLNENRRQTNVILGERYHTLWGRDALEDELAGVRLSLAAPAFYQINHAAATLLYAKARALAAPRKTDTLLDLYCGVGSIGLSMADAVGEVIGVEIVPAAVECAIRNAARSSIRNASFYTGDAGQTADLLRRAEQQRGAAIHPDIILVDPPRAGLSGALIPYLTSLAPRALVYISCNPATLARDLSLFRRAGWQLGDVFPYDLFPATGHVESAVCLTRHNELPLA